MRRTVQHDEVSNLPNKGRLPASVSLSLVSVLTRLRGRSSVSLSPVPRDDNRKLHGLSSESIETSQRSAANDDTNRLSRRRLERAVFLCGLRVFARHNRLIRQRSSATLPLSRIAAQSPRARRYGQSGLNFDLASATAKASRSFPKHCAVRTKPLARRTLRVRCARSAG